jgi:hypothetical protein
MPLGFPRHLRLLAGMLGFLACAALARPAHAQLGTAGTTGTTAATLVAGDIFIGIQQTQGTNLAAFDLARFFNKANCDCNLPVFVYFTLTSTGFAKRPAVPAGTVSFWVGTQCGDPILQRTGCRPLAGPGQPSSEQITTFMAVGRNTVETTAQIISTQTVTTTNVDGGVLPVATTATGCTSSTNGFQQTVWAVFDFGADGTLDFAASQAVFVDLVPPPAPTNITVSPGNEAVSVKWTPVDYSLNTDLQGYQILCQRGDLQVFPTGTFGQSFKTCKDTRVGVGVAALDPDFVCSPLLNRSDASYRVKILQNDIYYGATVVAIDTSGNASAPLLNGDGLLDGSLFTKPQKTNSFYDVYRNGNETNGGAGQMAVPGAATGGFCAVAGESHRGRWGAGIGVSVLAAAAIARARRRRSR